MTWDESLATKFSLGSWKLVPSVANVITILANHPDWRDVLVFDECSLQIIFGRSPPWHSDDSPKRPQQAGDKWTDDDYTRVASWLQRTRIADLDPLKATRSLAEEAVPIVARKNSIDPLQDYVSSLRHDGVARIDTWLHDYMGAANTKYTQSVGAWWLISAVSRALNPGCQVDHVLVFEGEQGAGKSTLLRTLGGPWFTDQVGDLGSKDSYLQLVGRWIIEFGELESISRSEVTRTKAFITARYDRFRPPYGRVVEEFGRRCVFAATTNQGAWLKDETGNRRFWPVACEVDHPVDAVGLSRVRNQLFAEAKFRLLAGEHFWPDRAQNSFIESEQDDRMVGDAFDSLIASWWRDVHVANTRAHMRCEECSKPPPCEHHPVTTADVLRDALKLPIDKWNHAEQMRVGACMARLGWKKARRTLDGRRQWVYLPTCGPPTQRAGGHDGLNGHSKHLQA